ncbi:hypothetical protein PWT90_04354 [Aphanocladium album]|nr:hypothetical protein PWT90_04354 [Aphanocladium album]
MEAQRIRKRLFHRQGALVAHHKHIVLLLPARQVRIRKRQARPRRVRQQHLQRDVSFDSLQDRRAIAVVAGEDLLGGELGEERQDVVAQGKQAGLDAGQRGERGEELAGRGEAENVVGALRRGLAGGEGACAEDVGGAKGAGGVAGEEDGAANGTAGYGGFKGVFYIRHGVYGRISAMRIWNPQIPGAEAEPRQAVDETRRDASRAALLGNMARRPELTPSFPATGDRCAVQKPAKSARSRRLHPPLRNGTFPVESNNPTCLRPLRHYYPKNPLLLPSQYEIMRIYKAPVETLLRH